MAARRGPFFSRTCTTTPLEGAEPRLGSPAAALSPSLGKGSMAGAAEAGGAPAGYTAAAAARSRRRAAPPARSRSLARSLPPSLAWVPPAADPSPPAPPFPPRRPRFSQLRPLPPSSGSPLTGSGLTASAYPAVGHRRRLEMPPPACLLARLPEAIGDQGPRCLRRLAPFLSGLPARPAPHTRLPSHTHTHTHAAPGPPAWAPTPNLPDSSENRRGKRAGGCSQAAACRSASRGGRPEVNTPRQAVARPDPPGR